MIRFPVVICAVLAAGLVVGFVDRASAQTTWNIDNPASVAGHVTKVVGNPTVVNTPFGNAVKFGGSDGIIVPVNPVAGASTFTVEMIFRPDPIVNTTSNQPRVLHIQSEPSPPDHRVTLETRTTAANEWYIDTFLQSQSASSGNPSRIKGLTLQEPTKLHPLGQWYNYAMTYDGATFKAWVNGRQEASAALAVQKLAEGRTSLGMRANQVNFFEGVIARVRFTASVVDAAHFMNPVPGDYDKSGAVDPADYDIWKAAVGTSVAAAGSGADGNSDGVVDGADYTEWRNNLPPNVVIAATARAAVE